MESEAAPYIGMLMAECAQAGLIIISKQVMANGMTNFVFVTYSNALASLVLLPFCFFLYRSGRPKFTFSIMGSFFLLGLIGCLAQLFGYAGINYSSPTLGTTMLNLVPGLTFMLAVIFRMEKLDWRNLTSVAKLTGTMVCIAGAFVVTLYQGPPLLGMRTPASTHHLNLLGEQSNWVLGGILLAIDCVLASSWVIIQALTLKKFPAGMIIVFFYCFFVAIQCGLFTLMTERDPSAWSLQPKLRLFSVLYSGFMGSAFQVGVSTWCLHREGPVFVCVFKPFGIAITVIAGALFFGDTFYLGSLLGVILIVLGFYTVMWGKAKEETTTEAKTPLLGNKVEETEYHGA